MNEKDHPFKNTDNFLKKTMQSFHPDKAQLLSALSVLKVNQDLNEGSLNLSEMHNLSVYGHIVKLAAQQVGCTFDEVAQQLRGVGVALAADFEDFQKAHEGVKEEVIEPSPTLLDYLSKLSGASKH